MARLVADEGHILTNGIITLECLDTAEPELWSEILFDVSIHANESKFN